MASLKAYEAEKSMGTEFIAILGWIEEWALGAEESLRRKRDEAHRNRIEIDRRNAEARLRSGADCPWTTLTGHAELFSRKNARLFCLRSSENKGSLASAKLEVLEVKSFEDKRGVCIGRYRTRTDATKAVLEVAYKPGW